MSDVPHWYPNEGGRKIQQSVYAKPTADNERDRMKASKTPMGIQSMMLQKFAADVQSNYFLPGIKAGQWVAPKNEDDEDVAAEEHILQSKQPLEKVQEVQLESDDKSGEPQNLADIEPHSMLYEFRRRQAELEQLVERICSVAAIKSESLVSLARTGAIPPALQMQLKHQQHQSSNPPTPHPNNSNISNATSSTNTAVRFNTQISGDHPTPVQQPMVAQPQQHEYFQATQPTAYYAPKTNNRSAKARNGDSSQYLGVPNDLQFAFDKPVYTEWQAPSLRHQPKIVNKTEVPEPVADYQPEAKPNLQLKSTYDTPPSRTVQRKPSFYNFELTGQY